MKKDERTDKFGYGKVGIIGLGFVGLPLALAFIRQGFDVIGIDLDGAKISTLNEGRSYLPDIEDEEIRRAVSSGKLAVSEQYDDMASAESIVICVPTPLSPQQTPDLSYLTDTCSRLVPLLRSNQLIVLESSTFPGTTKEVVQPLLERSGLAVGEDIFLAYSPERIDPGNKQLTIDKIPKVVSGITERCLDRVYKLYSQVFEQVVPVSTTETAEAAKLLENSFRLVNISFMNEFAKICEKMNVNVWEVIEAARTKPYGFMAFYPGPGVGGHCIPVDPLYLQWKARQLGTESRFIELSHLVNESMPVYIVEELKRLLAPSKSISESRVLVYGITYKKDTPDLRESTAIPMMQLLIHEGASVQYHDPFIPSVTLNDLTLNSVSLTEAALRSTDVVLIHTDHTAIPIDSIVSYAPLVYDTRNATKRRSGRSKVAKLGGGSALSG
ncbi:nucleotide sugar dehydrogenase [Paenibacillus ehimensis]|uniref:nucleotide sugar dehydrogenase n=1 Tax=Paenibacillus ehimensis TaxID=79264 RepID=UPI000470F0F2|nr:nucleotide sugar dehydrogenase [Paenibacillus ehimensis]